jgi:hypothetical protein
MCDALVLSIDGKLSIPTSCSETEREDDEEAEEEEEEGRIQLLTDPVLHVEYFFGG